MTAGATSPEPPTSTSRPPRRNWTLQARLMVAVIGVVSLIFVSVGFATSAVLTSILQENLQVQVVDQRPNLNNITRTTVAADVLDGGRQPAGYLLVLNVPGGLTGAYVTETGAIASLSDDQVTDIVDQLERNNYATVTVDGLGEYLIGMVADPSGVFAAYGLPTSEVSSTLAQILTTVTLLTAGGLLLLGAIVAIVIRAGLRPLRTVADTAQRVAETPLSEGEVSITERVPVDDADAHTEVGRVGTALNTLLDHVDSSLEVRQRNEERMRQFVADASHELRTPLASIRGYSELSLRDPELGENTASALERIQAQSLRMTALVEDLLLLARLEEGQELVYGAVDLSRMAVEAVGDAQAAGREHDWEIELDEEPVIVAGDEPRLHQVLVNLLANARTHTPAGTVVTTQVHRDGKDAVISVHDDGPGIEPAIADELFERFARADSSRARKTGGSGLGLSIARAIVEAHRGSIAVTSAPGDTTFTVRLAARPDAPATAQD